MSASYEAGFGSLIRSRLLMLSCPHRNHYDSDDDCCHGCKWSKNHVYYNHAHSSTPIGLPFKVTQDRQDSESILISMPFLCLNMNVTPSLVENPATMNSTLFTLAICPTNVMASLPVSTFLILPPSSRPD